jgi:hypothetical protein
MTKMKKFIDSYFKIINESPMPYKYEPYYWGVSIGDKGLWYSGVSKSELKEKIEIGLNNGSIKEGEHMWIYRAPGENHRKKYIIQRTSRGTIKWVKPEDSTVKNKMIFTDSNEALRYLKDQKFDHVYARYPYFIVRTTDYKVEDTKKWLKSIGATDIKIDDPQVKPYDINKWLVDIRFKLNVLNTQELTY